MAATEAARLSHLWGFLQLHSPLPTPRFTRPEEEEGSLRTRRARWPGGGVFKSPTASPYVRHPTSFAEGPEVSEPRGTVRRQEKCPPRFAPLTLPAARTGHQRAKVCFLLCGWETLLWNSSL